MNFVQPIRDMDQIYYIKKFLRERSERNYLLFVTGINSGLRISDLLRLRVRDAKRMYIDLREKKTGKQGVPHLVTDGEWVRGYEPGQPFSEAFARHILGLADDGGEG